jgi:uncharacterized protein YkwD
MLRALTCLVALVIAVPAGANELVTAVNAIRMQGCGGQPGVEQGVRPSKALDEVARVLSRGEPLGRALRQARYAAARSASIHIEGTTSVAAMRRVLRDEYCAAVNDAAFAEMGVFRRRAQTWMVLAEPLDLPDPADQEQVARDVLDLVNSARARPKRCGRERFAATHPLELDATLSSAARLHAGDMATHSAMSHRGSDGSEPAERVTRAGYQWRAVAENVAAGQRNAAAVVAHWLDSPGHCASIMGPQFTAMGLGFAIEAESEARIYWAQVFAAPR